MTQQDKREMFKANLQRAIFNAHKHGLSWKDLRDILTDYLKTFPLE
jgi:DNA-binding transcriptional regulator YhcF (GntR family)